MSSVRADAANSAPAWSVAGLLQATADALQARFGAVAVRGELSGYVRAASGHCYFSLKDADGAPALVRCAMFRRAASLVAFQPADGQQVELRGRIGVYESRGELQLVVESLQRLGSGTLYEEFLRRRERLERAGLFAADRKRPLPTSPRTLGVITSLGAAALRDVLIALKRRSPQVRVIVYPALVQGGEAPAALIDALETANRRAEVDAVLLVRGGGSLEDLWAFNDEGLTRAVAASTLPVICGVGHETDVTLCDLAADLRAATPTAAAELAAPALEGLLNHLDRVARGLNRAVDNRLAQHAQRLDTMALRLGAPAQRLAAQHQRLDAAGQRCRRAVSVRLLTDTAALPRLALRLQRSTRQLLQQRALRLAGDAHRLAAHDPQRILQRGYAWIEARSGRPVLAAAELVTGQSIRAVWADGAAWASIESLEGPGAPR